MEGGALEVPCLFPHMDSHDTLKDVSGAEDPGITLRCSLSVHVRDLSIGAVMARLVGLVSVYCGIIVKLILNFCLIVAAQFCRRRVV